MKKRLSTPRAATVIVLAAVVALSVTVAPSIASSFLTSQAASKEFVTKQKAASTYVTKKQANAKAANYLTKKAAANTYATKKSTLLQPGVAIAASNTLYSVNQSGSGYIPSAFASFATKAQVSDAVITFSGNASCSLPGKAPTVAQYCPITVLVDGQAAATKVGFAPATSEGTTKEPVAALNHTVMVTTVLGKGGHTVAIQYAGAAFLSFQLRSFNLAVQTYPQPEEEPSTTTTTPPTPSS